MGEDRAGRQQRENQRREEIETMNVMVVLKNQVSGRWGYPRQETNERGKKSNGDKTILRPSN